MTKIALSTNQAGTGSITIAAPNTNIDRTFTLPDAAGTAMLTDTRATTAQMPAGSVLQVIHTSDNTYINTSSTTPVATGLSASITPSSSSSKILVVVDLQGVGANASNTAPSYNLYRDGSSVHEFDRLTGYTTAGGSYASSSTTYLDSPSTTSSVTYQIYYSRAFGTGIITFNNYAIGNTSISTMTLMEIAA